MAELVAIALLALASFVAVANLGGTFRALWRQHRGEREGYSSIPLLSLLFAAGAWFVAPEPWGLWCFLPALVDPGTWMLLGLPYAMLQRGGDLRRSLPRETRRTPRPDRFSEAELDRTLRVLRAHASPLAAVVETARGDPMDTASTATGIRVALSPEEVADVVDALVAAAGSDPPDGAVDPKEREVANLAARWGRFERWLGQQGEPTPFAIELGNLDFRGAVAAAALDLLLPETLPEVATRGLTEGLDSPALARLAGEAPDPSAGAELRAELARALEELGIPRPAPREAARTLRDAVAAEVIAGSLAPRRGAEIVVRGVLERRGAAPPERYLGADLDAARLVGLFYDYDECGGDPEALAALDRAVRAECRRLLRFSLPPTRHP